MGSSPHRSASQITKYSDCPRKYRYHYIDKIKDKNSIHFPVGSSIDNALSKIINSYDFEPLFQSFHGKNRDPELTPMEAIDGDEVLSNWIKEVLAEFLDPNLSPLSQEELESFTEEEVTYLKTCQLHFSKVFKLYLCSLLESGLMPIKAQHEISYKVKGIDAILTGFIDMISKNWYDDRIVIVDFKTTSKRVAEASVDHKRQSWLYSKAVADEYKLDYLPTCEIHYFNKSTPSLPRPKKKDNHVNGVAFDPEALKTVPFLHYPEELIQSLYLGKTIDDFVDRRDAIFDRGSWDTMCEVLFDIEHSISHDFWPKNPKHTWCSPKGCGYWEICMGSEGAGDSLSNRRETHLRGKKVQAEFSVSDVQPKKTSKSLPPPPLVNRGDEVKKFQDFLIN